MGFVIIGCIPPPSPISAFLQMMVIPLNFVHEFPNQFLPQAWSLGLESMFYIVIPFVLIYRARTPLALISLLISSLAFWDKLDIDMWGYRLLPGTFFIFMVGSFVYQPQDKMKFFPLGILFSSTILLFFLHFCPNLTGQGQFIIKISILGGLILGTLGIYVLDKFESFSNISNIMGDLSYGVFLNHILVISLVLHLLKIQSKDIHEFNFISKCFFFVLILALSTSLSFLSLNFIEKPFLRFRKKQRALAICKS